MLVIYGDLTFEGYVAGMLAASIGIATEMRAALKHEYSTESEILDCCEGPCFFRFNGVLHGDFKSVVTQICREGKKKHAQFYGDSTSHSCALTDYANFCYLHARDHAQANGAVEKSCPNMPKCCKCDPCKCDPCECACACSLCACVPGKCDGGDVCHAKRGKCKDTGCCKGETQKRDCCDSCTEGGVCEGKAPNCKQNVGKGNTCRYTRFFACGQNEYLKKNTYLYGQYMSAGDIMVVACTIWRIYRHSREGGCCGCPLARAGQYPMSLKELKSNYVHLYRLVNTLSQTGKFDEFIKMDGGEAPFFAKHSPMPVDTSASECTFSWEEFKRIYSNSKDITTDAIPFLKENFNPKTMAIWHMKYDKLDGECTVGFVTSNQLKGFMQRFDNNFRKVSMGVTYVAGENGVFDILGLFIVAGSKQLPSGITEHPSCEYNAWTKLDINKDISLILDYLTLTEEIEKRPVVATQQWK